MHRKLFNFYIVLTALFFFEIFSNQTLNLDMLDQDILKNDNTSTIAKRDGIGFITINSLISNSFQLLFPLAELLADKNIKAVVLLLGDHKIAMRCAWTCLTDLQKLKKAYGKPIIAYSESVLSGEDYVIACGADAILVSPLAKVGGIGYRWEYEYSYEKDKADEKLLHLIYSGKFKDINLHMPPKSEHIKMFEYFVNQAFDSLVKDIIARRPNAGLNKDRWIQGNWFAAKEAMTYGLIDAVSDKIDLIGYVINFAGCSGLNLTNMDLVIKKQINDLSFVHIADSQKPTIGVLKIEELNNRVSWQYGQNLLELFQDESIEKIVLYFSCFGGEADAAISLHNDILKLKQLFKKPVIAYVDVAVSGGYYIASAADYIIAGPGALIGSVGVCMERWDFTKKNKTEQVKVVSISSGKAFSIGDTSVVLSNEAKELLQKQANLIHAKFIQDVKASRPKLKNNDESIWAEAQKFIAHDALKIGLIDAIGTPLDVLCFGNQESNNKLHDLNFVFKSITQNKK